LLRADRPDEGIVQRCQRDAPPRHRALRVSFQDRFEGFDYPGPVKGMVKSGGALKMFLGVGVTRHRKIYLSEPFALGEHSSADEDKNCESKQNAAHNFQNASFMLCKVWDRDPERNHSPIPRSVKDKDRCIPRLWS
jgi:hypothetical protein